MGAGAAQSAGAGKLTGGAAMLNAILHDVTDSADVTALVTLTDVEDRTPVDLTGHVIILQATPDGSACGPTLTASSEANDGSLVILPPPTMGVFQLRWTAAQMSGNAPVNYNIGGTISFAGETEPLIVGVFNKVKGWVR